MQVKVMTGISANLTKGWYIGTHNTATAKQSLHYRKAKSFHRRWNHQELTIVIEPPQLPISYALDQLNTRSERPLFYQGPDRSGLRTAIAHQQQQCVLIYHFSLQNLFKNFESQRNIFVRTVLRDHEDKFAL